MTTVDPPGVAHRIHVSTTTRGYEASCATCRGWRIIRATREQRQRAITKHLTAIDEETD